MAVTKFTVTSKKFQLVLPSADRKRLVDMSKREVRSMSDVVRIALMILEGILSGKFMLTTPNGDKMPSGIAL